MLRHKTVAATTMEELLVASKDPSVISITLAPGDYGWCVLSDVAGINITSLDPSRPAVFRHLGFVSCREMRVSNVIVRFGATLNPSARVVELQRCRNVVLEASRIEGNSATKKWNDVPIGISIANSTGVRMIRLAIRYVSNVVVASASRNLRLTDSVIGPASNASAPHSVEVDECTLSDGEAGQARFSTTYSPRWGIVPSQFSLAIDD